MSEHDVVKPYEGPPATPDNFTRAYPQFEEAAKAQSAAASTGVMPGSTFIASVPYAEKRERALRPLDPASQRNLDELKRRMRSTPPKGATVINLHPWPLQFPSTDIFLRGIVVPACNPGQEFAHHHIRTWSWDKKLTDTAENLVFGEILPIHKAAQFLISFGNPEVYGGGVIIYEGENHPGKVKDVETYYQNGALITTSEPGVEVDQEGHKESIIMQVPIRRVLAELLEEQTRLRNDFYMAQVQEADDNMKSQERARKRLVTDRHRLMAEVLHACGVLPVMPDWNMATRMMAGLTEDNCQCGNPVKKGSYKCGTCSRIIDPLAAYKDAAIEFGHVAMDRMTADEWAEAEEIKAERDKARNLARDRRRAAAVAARKERKS